MSEEGEQSGDDRYKDREKETDTEMEDGLSVCICVRLCLSQRRWREAGWLCVVRELPGIRAGELACDSDLFCSAAQIPR